MTFEFTVVIIILVILLYHMKGNQKNFVFVKGLGRTSQIQPVHVEHNMLNMFLCCLGLYRA
jgi:hypothetical protein